MPDPIPLLSFSVVYRTNRGGYPVAHIHQGDGPEPLATLREQQLWKRCEALEADNQRLLALVEEQTVKLEKVPVRKGKS